MKRLLFWALAAFMFAACVEDVIDEQDVQQIVDDAPESLTVGFEENDTRVQLNEATKTVWTKDDLVSVFYRSNANQKWQYQGETGERVGNLKRLENGTGTTKTTKTVVVYPYSENYWLNTDSYAIDANLPATQYYTEDSYGVGCNLLVSQSEFTQFSLKSVCGWLKLQLTGNGKVVKSIKFCGNKGEQVAGLIYVDTDTAESTLASEMGSSDDNNVGGNLIFDDTILTEVTLDCGEGVTLGAESTAFYIALPPQTFAEGFTVEVNCVGYKPMTISTSKKVVIERNHIQPMAAVEHEAEEGPGPKKNEIWYTNGSTTEVTTPDNPNAFGANIVSNLYDAEKVCWVITFDSDVTTIGDYAFGGCSLTSVRIPDSVTSIGEKAFTWSCLASVRIPDSVTSIGWGAFEGCDFTRVIIPDSVTSIGSEAFTLCRSLTSVTIGSGVTSIGGHAFASCYRLTSISIPNSVTSIGNSAFFDCSSLTSVTIGSGVTSIGEDAFSYCSSLTSVTIPDSVTSIGDSAFSYCSSLTAFYGKFASADNRCLIIDGRLNSFAPAGLTEYTIPDNITSINAEAFSGCSCLTSVTIPNSVTSIGEWAFYGCSCLTSVTIPDSVTSIGQRAFSGCSCLTSVTIPDSVTYIGDCAFDHCSSLTAFYGKFASADNRYVIIDGVLHSFAPAGLTEYTIPDSITAIGESAFRYCSSLTSVTIPDSVTSIGDSAFSDCSSLTSVTIPDSVTSFGTWAFYKCSSLTSVTIGNSVTEIGPWAFNQCSSLKSVYCKPITPPSSEFEIFSSNDSSRKIYVPMESVSAYKSASGWSDYADCIVGYDF